MSSPKKVSISNSTNEQYDDSLPTINDGLDSPAEPVMSTSTEGSCTEAFSVEDNQCQWEETSGTRLNLVDFYRWRPKRHIMAARGWMNDPCAPGYNPRNGSYHVNFQWNPKSYTWGNMSWGFASSPNLIDWTILRKPSMTPTATHDRCGVFTGALQPSKEREIPIQEKEILTAFYTSAQKLPINHRLPYTRGCEKIALATSADGGQTWQRQERNVLISEPPDGYDVIGWRDPFVGTWDSLSNVLQTLHSSHSCQYGIVSGGLRGRTPTVFLYRICPKSLEWTFLCSLVNLGLNYQPSRWTGGDFGTNWEVTNFLTLSDDQGRKYEILITGVEGMKEGPNDGELSKDHRQMWMCGTLQRSSDGVTMQYRFGGTLDHGAFYAANGFWDPLTEHFLTFGWIFEEDLAAALVARQGWSGCLSMPRIASLRTWRGVVGTTHTHPTDITCFYSYLEADGTFTVQTLSLTPDTRSQAARVRSLAPSQPFQDDIFACTPCQTQLEFVLDLKAPQGPHRVGFDLLHSSDHSEYTRLYFDPPSETFIIDRSHSTTTPGVNVSARTAPHTLFTFRHGRETRREDLKFHVFFDTSVLEVFVNERVAVTTRVYPDEGTCYGIRLYSEKGPRHETAVIDVRNMKGIESARSTVKYFNIWPLRGLRKYTE